MTACRPAEDDGWSKEPVTIDGKQYLYKSGFAEAGSIIQTRRPDGLIKAYKLPEGSLSIGELVVLLKPVEPDPPRYPTPDDFFDPRTFGIYRVFTSADDTEAAQLRETLRRQLESEERAVQLLRDCVKQFDGWGETEAFLCARDEGLPWPEESK